MADKARKLDALTGLRFLAAAAIVLLHSGYFGVPGDQARSRWNLGAAVDLFFILSGFILAYVYPRLEGAGERGRFLLARFARLWPAHALGFVLVVLLFEPATPPAPGLPTAAVACLNLGMVHSWLPVHNVHFSYNGQSWSIATEFAFYLFFLVLIPGWRRTWHVKLLLAFLLAVAAPSLWSLAGLPGDRGPDGTIGMWFHPLTRLFEFTLGMATALLWQKLPARRRPGPALGTLVELLAAGLAVAALYGPLSEPVASRVASWFPYAGSWVASAAVLHLPLALLIVVLAGAPGGVSALLATRPAVLLGEISYTIYLMHGILVRYYGLHVKAFAEWPPWLVYGGFWAVLLVLCHFVWAWVERPARQWLVGLWPRPGTTATRTRPAVWRWAVGEGVVLASLLVSVAWYANLQPYRFLSRRTAAALAARGEPTTRNTAFGDLLILRAAVFRPVPDGLRLKLVWESCRHQNADQLVAVHLLDRAGKILRGADYQRRLGRPALAAGALWEERVDLSGDLLAGATQLGICVTPAEGTGLLPVLGGPSDWFQRRLLVPLPARH